MAFRIFMLLLIVVVLGVGILDYLNNFEKNECEMTYMFVKPQYLQVDLEKSTRARFPRYGLYFYGEGEYADNAKASKFRMSGIPVLFIPGNAGSYRQVRSLGSVAQKKSENQKAKFHFNYFSLDFDEEFPALYGNALYEEAEFAHLCIQKILSLYKGAASPPKSVILVGHSMGGMVARALFTLPDFKPELVTTIITQATPHQAPAISGDPVLAQFYTDVNTYWRQHENTTVADVTVFSTGGGYRDILVRSHLTSLSGIVRKDRSVSSNTMSVPAAWVSTDHLCHVWCKQMVLVTKRAMFDIIDVSTKQVAVSPFYRVAVFMHHFFKNPGSKKFRGAYDKTIALDKNMKWEIRKKFSWKLWTDSFAKMRYSVTEMPPLMGPPEYIAPEYGYVAISNINNDQWLGICSLREKPDPSSPPNAPKKNKKPMPEKCSQMNNHAPFADQLPPLYSDKKVVHIDPETVRDNTHIVVVLPKTKKRIELYSELYPLNERFLDYNMTGLLDFLKGFPRSVMDLDIIINKTAPGAIFYNISLNDLDIPLQAYTAHLTTLSCTEAPPVPSSGAVMKLFVPWAHEHTYTVIKSGDNGSMPLKLMTARPINVINTAQLHLYLLPTCTYKLSITIAWTQLFGQFIRFYAVRIVAFLAIQVLMVLSWQMKSLDEQGEAPDFSTSHARWAQPWRVVPLGLLIRFMLYYPEEDNMAMKLGIPQDDRAYMESQGEWYAALPIMLYLSAYAIMGLYAIMVHLVLATFGKVFGGVVMRLQGDDPVSWFIQKSQYILYIAAFLLSTFICGSFGIILVYFVTIIKTVCLYTRAHRQPRLPAARWSAYNIHTSLILLLLLTFLLSVPSLMAWMKNINYSIQLVVDPSRTVGMTISIIAIILSLIRFPVHTGELYGIAAALLYMTSVLMVLFTLVSVHRIPTYLYSALIIITSCAVLSFFLERPIMNPPPSESTKPKTE